MKKLLFVLACFQSIFTFGQNNDFKWSKHFSGSDDNYGISIAVDAAGNTYTGGYFMGTSDLNPGTSTLNVTSNGSNDAYICKLDHLGNFLWAKHIGGIGDDQILSVTVDDSGNVYATGYFTETVDFNPGTGVFNRTTVGFKDIFVLKLDANGNFLWVKTFGGTDTIYGDIGNSITLDDLGNVYITGTFRGIVDFDPGVGVVNMNAGGVTLRSGFISKLDASGNFLWAKGFIASEGSLIPKSIAIDPQGNIYTAGELVGTTDFDPGTGTYNLVTHGNSDAFAAKLNASGNFVWAKNWGSISNDGALSLAIDASQNVYTTGYFSETADFDPSTSGNFEVSSIATTDIFISKLNSTGNFEWAKSIGSSSEEEGNSIFTMNGSVYVTGYFRNVADFDPDPVNTYNLTASGSNADIFVLKMNDLGQFIWAERIGSTSIDKGNSIVVDSADNIFITGRFNFTVDFDPDPVDAFEIYTSQPGAFVLKLGSTCSPINHSISESACGSFTWTDGNGATYTSSTSVSHTFVDGAANGCDSIVTLNLTINQPTSSILNVTNCGSYTLNGQTYSTSGTFNQVIPNTANCDSTITLNLIVKQPTSSTLNITNCGPYTLNGQTYTTSGTFNQVIPNTANCDSTITLNLIVKQPTSSILNITNCGPYTLNGQTYPTSGTFNQVIPNTANCDSTITLNLIVKQPTSSILNVTNCGPYTLNGQTYTTSGTFNQVIPNTANCDSTITLNLTINNVNHTVSLSGTTLTASQSGGTYQWIDCTNGNTPVPGANSQSFSPTSNGNYAVAVTVNGCTETSNCVEVTTLGIETMDQNGWQVFPNPTTGVFSLISSQEFNNQVIEIYSSFGQLIYSSISSGKEVIIDLKEQSTGIYILKVEEQQVFKIIKL